MIASCDADGTVKFWDIRTVSEIASIKLGPHPANKLVFDPSGKTLSVVSNDGTLYFISTIDKTMARSIHVSESALHSLSFDKSGESLVTGSSGMFCKLLLIYM